MNFLIFCVFMTIFVNLHLKYDKIVTEEAYVIVSFGFEILLLKFLNFLFILVFFILTQEYIYSFFFIF